VKPSTMTSEEKRDAIIAAAEDKKANYVTVIDLRGKTIITDFFVICSGTSNIHIRSIADGVMESLEKQGVRQNRMEGYSEATWVILDYGDSIVHVMAEDERGYYSLEKLWGAQRPPRDEDPMLTIADEDEDARDPARVGEAPQPAPEAEDAVRA